MVETVLVTGANGFLGNNLVRSLLEQNYKVIALVRKNSKIEILDNLDCKVERINSYDSNNLEKIISESDYVIHCASKTDQWTMNFKKYIDSNVTTTQALTKLCKKHHVKRFVLVSSANCFTNGSLSKPGTEESSFMNFFRNSGYAYSKYIAQKYILKEVKENNFPAIIVAPTFLLGAYDTKPSSGALTQYVLKNKILFYPKGGKSFVDVNYVTESIIQSLKKGKIGECYLLSGINVSYRDYYSKVIAILGEKKVLIPIPKFILSFSRIISALFRTKKTQRLEANMKALFLENYFSNAKAKKELSMKDTDLDKSIKETIKWLSNIK